MPACNPLPTSGLTYIRLHLPTAKVVNCVLIRLYKPRVGNSIGLLQIRLMGSCAFGKNAPGPSNIENDDDFYCHHSLGDCLFALILKETKVTFFRLVEATSPLFYHLC